MPAPTRTATKLKRLRIRAEFLRVANSGKRASMPSLLLQFAPGDGKPRYGLTATKKLGNAVIRNRARRQLRVLAEKVLVPHAVAGDYVLVAREGILTRSLDAIEKDLVAALQKLSCLKK